MAPLLLLAATVNVWVLVLILTGAFGVQLIAGEPLCPLCVVQRSALMMCALGPLYLLRHHRVRPAMNLDHVTLRTADLEVTRGFLERVLDLKPGYRTAGRDQTGFAGDEDDPAPVAFQHAREAHH